LNNSINGSTPFVKADCYTFTLIDGSVYRYADYMSDVTVNGVTYTSSGIKMSRNQVTHQVGVAADTMEMYLQALPTDVIEGMPWYAAIRLGKLDGCTVDVDVAVAQTPTSGWAGTFNWFSGSVSTIQTVSRTGCTLEVTTDAERMAIMMPRRVYQPSCSNTLFDAACGLNRLSYVYGSQFSGPADGTGSVYISAITNAALVGYFDQGYVMLTAGPYAGFRKTIKYTDFYAGYLRFWFFEPWPATLSATSFNAYPGCDRQKATCSAKFNNLIHFTGYPYIPVPETVS
jgi:uncharacterized phage protein (TIGR02218 family)